jgi:Glycosyltransferase family 87
MKRLSGTIIVGLVCFSAILFLHAGMVRRQNDVKLYQQIGERAFDDPASFESEYPPLMTSVFALMATGGRDDFVRSWMLLLLLCALGTGVWGLVRHDEICAAFPIVLALSVLLLGPTLVLARFDILVLVTLFLAWRAREGGRPAESGFWLALAVAIKLVPVLLLPLFLVMFPRGEWKRVLAGFAGGSVISLLCASAVLGLEGLSANTAYMLSYHAARGLQVESFLAGLLILGSELTWNQIGIGFHHGAYHVVTVPAWTPLLTVIPGLAGAVIITWLGWRHRASCDAFRSHLLALLFWCLATGTVLSPQYLVWVIPLAFLAPLEDRNGQERPWTVWWFLCVSSIAVAAMTHWMYPSHYEDVVGFNMTALLVLNARNFLLLFLALFLLRQHPRAVLPGGTHP